MYKLFKKIYRNITPNKFHYIVEPFIRVIIYYLIYKGDNVQCNICLSKSKKSEGELNGFIKKGLWLFWDEKGNLISQKTFK